MQQDLFRDLETNDLPSINDLIKQGALFVINHSAGKDSQAMANKLMQLIPHDQLLIIHAHLGDMEWAGVKEHIVDTTSGLPMIVAHPVWKDGTVKTFVDMVIDRHHKITQANEIALANGEDVKDASPWPSPSIRQCTSDLKTGPINREIRRYLKKHPEFKGQIVNCIGIRAEESTERSKKSPFIFDEKNSTKKGKNGQRSRTWYEWLPIFDLTEKEVFQTIKEAGQKPHWAYKLGMTRLSCVICVMARVSDLRLGATHNPKTYAELVMLEKETGKTMMMPVKGVAKTLEEITGIQADLKLLEQYSLIKPIKISKKGVEVSVPINSLFPADEPQQVAAA